MLQAVKIIMKIIIGLCIFCLVLFIYLHIQFHLKKSNDLEMYEIDQPSKEKLEEIIRHAHLDRLMKSDVCEISAFEDEYIQTVMNEHHKVNLKKINKELIEFVK